MHFDYYSVDASLMRLEALHFERFMAQHGGVYGVSSIHKEYTTPAQLGVLFTNPTHPFITNMHLSFYFVDTSLTHLESRGPTFRTFYGTAPGSLWGEKPVTLRLFVSPYLGVHP